MNGLSYFGKNYNANLSLFSKDNDVVTNTYG
jgi:hypothetical protein